MTRDACPVPTVWAKCLTRGSAHTRCCVSARDLLCVGTGPGSHTPARLRSLPLNGAWTFSYLLSSMPFRRAWLLPSDPRDLGTRGSKHVCLTGMLWTSWPNLPPLGGMNCLLNLTLGTGKRARHSADHGVSSQCRVGGIPQNTLVQVSEAKGTNVCGMLIRNWVPSTRYLVQFNLCKYLERQQ